MPVARGLTVCWHTLEQRPPLSPPPRDIHRRGRARSLSRHAEGWAALAVRPNVTFSAGAAGGAEAVGYSITGSFVLNGDLYQIVRPDDFGKMKTTVPVGRARFACGKVSLSKLTPSGRWSTAS